MLFIIIETALWFGTIYAAKRLIGLVSKLNIGSIHQKHDLVVSLAIIFTIGLLYTAVKIISSIIIDHQSLKVSEFIDNKIHKQAIHLDFSFYESPSYFDILKRARDAGSDRPAAIITDLMELAKNIIMIVAIGTVLVSIHWALLPLLVLFIIPGLLVKVRLAKRLQLWKIEQTPTERKASYFSDLITSDISAKEIRAFGIGAHINNIYINIRQNLLKEKLSINRKSFLGSLITSLLSVSGVYSCVAAISFSTLNGKTDVGDLSVFIIIFLQTFNVLQSITSGIAKLYANSIVVKCIFDMFDLQATVEETENPSAININTDSDILLKTENLHFTYPFSDREALKGIDIEIKRGKITALVGYNGSGKSTLLKLLCRLYNTDKGTVQFLGKDIRQYNMEAYRKEISVVFQDFVRYNVTASDNIKYGNINRPYHKDEIVAAAKAAGADGFVNELPAGYQTMMGKTFEDGHEISSGQWQKLAISRALYSDAQIIILDEATSALDSFSEEQLFKNLKKDLGQKGALIISHRLSTIQKADYIYVMAEGTIKQAGTHQQLMEQVGDYRLLFNSN